MTRTPNFAICHNQTKHQDCNNSRGKKNLLVKYLLKNNDNYLIKKNKNNDNNTHTHYQMVRNHVFKIRFQNGVYVECKIMNV